MAPIMTNAICVALDYMQISQPAQHVWSAILGNIQVKTARGSVSTADLEHIKARQGRVYVWTAR
jgi:hypothetical protein